MAKKEVITFEPEKETKRTLRFSEKVEGGKPPILGTVYIQKWFLGEEFSKKPGSIRITVEIP